MPVTNRPNILYLHSHDTGRYVQPYGYAVPTPALQQLAEQGVLFRKSFSVSPTCSPSRSALLTGMYPHTNGMTGLAHRGWRLNDYTAHIRHRLSQHGYTATLIGTQHIIAHDAIAELGYDHTMPWGTASVRTDAAVDFLAASPSEPFFLSVGFEETHREFLRPSAGRGDDPRYTLPPTPLPDTPAIRDDMAAFHATARLLDDCYGRVLAALDSASLSDRTLVICTTDHGIAFPGMKCTLTDHGIGVLLIMCGPGGFTGGQVVDAMVTHLDVMPTILDLLGFAPDSALPGKSLLPLMRGEVDGLHDAIFAEVNYHAAYEPQRAVRTDRYKYIRRYGGRQQPVLANCDDSPSKTEWLDYGWDGHDVAEEYLYDLAFDPNEASNLVANPDMAPIRADMRARLDQWMRDTSDPLFLTGHVPAPPGAIVNRTDARSPNEPTVDAGHRA